MVYRLNYLRLLASRRLAELKASRESRLASEAMTLEQKLDAASKEEAAISAAAERAGNMVAELEAAEALRNVKLFVAMLVALFVALFALRSLS